MFLVNMLFPKKEKKKRIWKFSRKISISLSVSVSRCWSCLFNRLIHKWINFCILYLCNFLCTFPYHATFLFPYATIYKRNLILKLRRREFARTGSGIGEISEKTLFAWLFSVFSFDKFRLWWWRNASTLLLDLVNDDWTILAKGNYFDEVERISVEIYFPGKRENFMSILDSSSSNYSNNRVSPKHGRMQIDAHDFPPGWTTDRSSKFEISWGKR